MTARTQRATVTLPLPIHRPDHWAADAACAAPDHDPMWWDGPREGEPEPDRIIRQDRAKAICGTCSVTAECRAAIVPGDEGVRAGRVIGDRPRTSKQPTKPRAPVNHGTPAGARAHWQRGELSCEPCRAASNAYRRANKKALKERRAS